MGMRWKSREVPLPLIASLGLVCYSGCYEGGEDPGADGGTGGETGFGTSGGTSDGGSSGSGGSTSGGDDGGADGGGDGTLPDPDEAPYASGIAVDEVRINQGVDVPVIQGGAALSPTQRVAPLIAGRPALVRVSWTLDPSFTSRPITARLTVAHQDGTFSGGEQTLTVSGAADLGRLDGAFAFEIPASTLRAGEPFVVGLLDEGSSGGDGSGGARVPASGEAEVGALDGMKIKVVVVPSNDPSVDPNPYVIPDAMRRLLEDDLYNTYPVQAVELEFHEPVQITGCSDGANILSQLSGYRNSEGRGPDVYYHAIFSDTHDNRCWAGGMAWLEDDSMGADRVSYSINHWGESPNNWGHELGHSAGRLHSFEDVSEYQPNAADGPDCGRRRYPGYALRGGAHPKAGEWDFPPMQNMDGWLIPATESLGLGDYCFGHADYDRDGPALNDMMSYAFPYWVSAYTFAGLAERQRVLSSWDGARVADRGESLHGVFLQDGSVRWYTMAGTPKALVDAEEAAATWTLEGGARVRSPVALKRNGEGEVHGVVIPQVSGAAALEVRVGERTLRPDPTVLRGG